MSRPPEIKDRKLIRDLRKQGFSFGEISYLTSIPKGSVHYIASDIKLTHDQINRLKNKQKKYHIKKVKSL